MGGCCGKCCGKKEDSFHKNVKKNEYLINGRWRMGRILGKGGYGKVYEVKDIKDNNKLYAMKTEEMRTVEGTGRLPQEAFVMEQLIGHHVTRHFPTLFDKGRIEEEGKRPVQFIVMTLLGPSLAQLRKLCPKSIFSPATVAIITIQSLEAIESMHSIGLIHRDIKPGNFMVGLHEHKHVIYLIDFGMARAILDEHGNLKPPRTDAVPFRGTVRYCATTTHIGVEYGRHDDLWCLFNAAIEMRKGTLPWETLEGNRKATYEFKHKIIPERWLQNIETEYLSFYENLTTLHYDMKPDYVHMKQIMERILDKEVATLDSPMDWEPTAVCYKKLNKKALSKLFREEMS